MFLKELIGLKNAEELFEMVKSMENEERWKFLLMMYNEYYCKGESISEEDIDWGYNRHDSNHD
jgi:hypothetical protein